MAEVAVNVRVYHDDYGMGTIVMDMGSQVQINWDSPQPGTPDHHSLLHDRSFVKDLVQLGDDDMPLPEATA
jgi:hypothetical protein